MRRRYKSSLGKRRRPFRRRVYRRRSGGLRKTIRRVVTRMSETKYRTVVLNSTNDAATPIFIKLFPTLAQGTGQTNRIGTKVKISSYLTRFKLAWSGATTPYTGCVRVLYGCFVTDPPTDPPSYSDIFDLSSDVNTGFTMMHTTPKLFRPMYDKTFMMSIFGDYNTNGFHPERTFKIRHKWNKSWNYPTDNSNNIPNLTMYPYLMVFSDVVQSGHNNMAVTGYTKVNFKDI